MIRWADKSPWPSSNSKPPDVPAGRLPALAGVARSLSAAGAPDRALLKARVRVAEIDDLRPDQVWSPMAVDDALVAKYASGASVDPPVVDARGLVLDGEVQVASAAAAGCKDMFVVVVGESLEKGPEDEIGDIGMDDADMLSALSGSLGGETEELLQEAAERGGELQADALDAGFDELQPDALKIVRERRTKLEDVLDEVTAQEVRNAIRRGMEDGDTEKQMIARLDELGAFGEARARRIARTETHSAVLTGSYESMRQNGVKFLVWESAPDARPTHREALGQRVRTGEAFHVGNAKLHYPGDPVGGDGFPEEVINCFLPGTLISGAAVAAAKSRYAGDAVKIVTRRGNSLSVTANHPVLTLRGFVAAKYLKKADRLICYARDVERRSSPEELRTHEYEVPSKVEDVFDSLFVSGARAFRAVRAEDLHGDGECVEGNVEVVRFDGLLLRDAESTELEFFGDLRFVSADVAERALAQRGYGLTPLDRDGLIQAYHDVGLGFGLSDGGVKADQGFSNPTPARGERASKGSKGLTGLVPSENVGLVDRLENPGITEVVAKSDSVFYQASLYGSSAYPETCGEGSLRCSSGVFLDEVLDVEVFRFSGHVYDLQTVTGVVVANGIVSSNCRCTMLGEFEDATTAEDLADEIELEDVDGEELDEEFDEEVREAIRQEIEDAEVARVDLDLVDPVRVRSDSTEGEVSYDPDLELINVGEDADPEDLADAVREHLVRSVMTEADARGFLNELAVYDLPLPEGETEMARAVSGVSEGVTEDREAVEGLVGRGLDEEEWETYKAIARQFWVGLGTDGAVPMRRSADARKSEVIAGDLCRSDVGQFESCSGGSAREGLSEDHRERLKSWARGRPDDEVDAVRAYAGIGYRDINALVRGKKVDGPEKYAERAERHAAALSKYVDASPAIDPPVVVWRGLSSDDDDRLSARIEQFKNHVGKRVRMDGFQSTSLSESVARDFGGTRVLLRIKTSKGAPVWPLRRSAEEESWDNSEKELLLGHGWSYRVESVEERRNGAHIVNLVAEGPAEHDVVLKASARAGKEHKFAQPEDAIVFLDEARKGEQIVGDLCRGNTGQFESCGHGLQASEKFKSWFGDSVVTDRYSSRQKTWEPKVVYHGTKGAFTEFQTGREGTNSNVFGSWKTRREGIFFSEDPEVAGDYAESGLETREVAGQSVIPAFIRVENPVDLTDGFPEDVTEAVEKAGMNPRYYYNLENVWEAFDYDQDDPDGKWAKKFIGVLKDLGYDGARMEEYNSKLDKTFTTWVVFDPKQVKSATGNTGEFSPETADVTKAEQIEGDLCRGDEGKFESCSGGGAWKPAREDDAKRQETLYAEAVTGVREVASLVEEVEGTQEPGIKTSWDDLSDDAKNSAGEAYWESNVDSEKESLENDWMENAAEDSVKEDLDNDDERMQELVNDALDENGIVPESVSKYSADTIRNIMSGNADMALRDEFWRAAEFHPAEAMDLREGEKWPPFQMGDPNQSFLPGFGDMDAVPPWSALGKDVDITLGRAIEEELKDRLDNAVPPDFSDEALDRVQENWNDMSDEEKMEAAVSSGVAEEEDREVRVPEVFKVLRNGENYAATGALGRALTISRAVQLAEFRYGKDPEMEKTLRKVENNVWDAWKRSSTSSGGLALQEAAAKELGAHTRDLTVAQAEEVNEYYESIGGDRDRGEALLRAYVRANWETTQFLMKKGGANHLDLYRAVFIPRDKFGKKEDVKNYSRLPELALKQNGASSWTADIDVANSWGGVGKLPENSERVVVRARVPATAVLSVPAYGKNVHGEQEVVVIGTPWEAWDAWKGRAPEVGEVGWSEVEHPRDAEGKFVAKAENLAQGNGKGKPAYVIDLDEYPVNWLAEVARAKRVRKNCGTGAGGFQEGNTCARGGGGVAWTVKDAAKGRLDALSAKARAAFAIMEKMTLAELAAHGGSLAIALWREKMGVKPSKWDRETLGVARGDKKEMRAVLRRFERDARMMDPESVSLVTRNNLESVLQRGLGPKMEGLKERFGDPYILAGVRTPEGGTPPQAEYAGDTIRVYATGFAPPKLEEGTPLPGAMTSDTHMGMAGVLRHEYGHHVERMLPDSTEKREAAEAWRKYREAHDAMSETFEGREAANAGIISLYSLLKEEEGFAEAFAVVTSPKYDRAKYSGDALEFLDAVERAIK